MFGMGWQELIIIGIIGILLFGSRLPNVARDLGRSIFSFKKGFKEVEQEVEEMGRDAEKEAKKVAQEIED